MHYVEYSFSTTSVRQEFGIFSLTVYTNRCKQVILVTFHINRYFPDVILVFQLVDLALCDPQQEKKKKKKIILSSMFVFFCLCLTNNYHGNVLHLESRGHKLDPKLLH